MLDSLRYPIGRYGHDGPLSADARARAIAEIAALPATLRAAVAGFTDAQLGTPYRPGGWNVRQTVHHVADSHANAYVRFRLALTEDAPTIKPYHEDRWAELPDATALPVDVSLTLLDALHARWAYLLAHLPEADFGRTYVHPAHGQTFTLDHAVGLYAWHGRHHTAHITRLREREGW